jgi:hypothetical protein
VKVNFKNFKHNNEIVKIQKKYEFEGNHMNYRYLGKTGLKVSELFERVVELSQTLRELENSLQRLSYEKKKSH